MSDQRPDRPTRKPARTGGTNGSGMRFGRGIFGWVLFIMLAIMLITLLHFKDKPSARMSLSDVQTKMDEGKVQSITVEGDDMTGTFVAPQPLAANRNR